MRMPFELSPQITRERLVHRQRKTVIYDFQKPLFESGDGFWEWYIHN